MVNWSLQPEFEEVTEDAEVPEVTETEEAPDPMDSLAQRIAAIEEANKRSEELANDIRRSVGRVQSLVDRIAKSSGDTKAQLEAQLEQRVGEMSGVMAELSESIDPAILPASVRDKVKAVNERAAARSAEKTLEQLIAEKVAAATPAPTTQIPESWLSFEDEMANTIRAAGLDPDDKSTFNWDYAGFLLSRGNIEGARTYFNNIIDANTTTLATKKANAPVVPTGGSVASAPKDDSDKLADPKVSLEEKIEILRKSGALK